MCALWREGSVRGPWAADLSCRVPLLFNLLGLACLLLPDNPGGAPPHLSLWNPGLPTSCQPPVPAVESGNQTRVVLAERRPRQGAWASRSQLRSSGTFISLYTQHLRRGWGATPLKSRALPSNGTQHPVRQRKPPASCLSRVQGPDIWSGLSDKEWC